LLVVLVACGSSKSEPSPERHDIPCDDVAAHAAELLQGETRLFAKRCERDAWSRKERACVRAAATARELDDCGLDIAVDHSMTPVVPARAVPLDQPKATPSDKAYVAMTLRVTIAADGKLYLNGDLVDGAELERKLSAYDKDTRIVIAADRSAPYANVVQL